MAFDNAKNLAKVTVSTGYNAAATSIVLSGGDGVKLPTPPFNVTWWNVTDYPDPSDDPNVEIVRVTAIATDTLTVTRGQEGITATTKNAAGKTYKMIAGLTAKTLNDDLRMALSQAASGRLTLESGVPISLTNQTAKTTIYYTPYQGNRIGLYDGTSWNFYSFSELSLALGTLTDAKNYDVFVYNNAGTLTLELSAAWTSDTARTDALVLQDGVLVKSGATTRRYLGTFRTTSTTTTEDSLSKGFVWNNYNRVRRELYAEVTSIHSYNGEYRPWNNNTSMRLEFVSGLAEDPIFIAILGQGTGVTHMVVAVGLDTSTSVYRYFLAFVYNTNGLVTNNGSIVAQIGYHYVQLMESTFSSGSSSFDVATLNIVTPR